MSEADRTAVDSLLEALVNDDDYLYDRAPCGYLSTDTYGTILRVNQTLCTLTGFDHDELVGRKRFADLLSGGGRIYHETHYMPMLQMHGEVREIALELVCKDGRRLPVLLNSVLEAPAAGRPGLIRTAVFDATHRREYEHELLLAKRRAEAAELRATALARTLQSTLIPPSPPAIPGLELAADYRPAGDGTEVGGDFYDVFQLGSDDWVVVIGDVCGKGIDAAVVTSLVRYTLRAAVVEHPRPADALRLLNRTMLLERVERFCTVALLRLRRSNDRWTFEISSGGHPLPRLRAADGTTSTVGRAGSLIGVLEDPDLYDVEITLGAGDMLLLHTDGVPDGRRGTTFFGEERIERILREEHGSAHSLVDALLGEVLAFQGGSTRDDIAIVVIEVC